MPNIGTREDLSVLRFRKGGCYFTSGILGVEGAGPSMSINTLRAIPFFVAKTEKFDRIAINITIATAAGKLARLGIYADTGLIAPGRLILDAGEVATDAVAVVEIEISQELFGGNLYWLASVNNGGPYMRGCDTGTLYSSFLGLTSTLGTSWGIGYSRTFTYAALPDPFGTPTTLTGTAPAIFLRKV